MFDFVGQVIHDFVAATALEKVGFLLSLTGLSTLFGVLFALFRLRNSRALIDQLRKDAAALAAERDRAESRTSTERAIAELWMPNQWLENARRERDQGNEGRAMQLLQEGFDRVRPGLARTGVALAGHHLSLTVGADPAARLSEAERMAKLAAMLDPDDCDAAFLVEDTELARLHGDMDQIPILPASISPTNREDALELVHAINSKALDYVDKGIFRIALRLFRRSALLISRGGLAGDRIAYEVEYKVAESLLHCGRYQEAMDCITALLELETQRLPAGDVEIFRARIMHANVLNHFSEHQEALSVLEEAIVRFEPILGSEHPYVLAARAQGTNFIALAGEPQRALSAATALLPLLVRVLGPAHPNTLVGHFNEVFSLAQLGRSAEALDRISGFLAVQTRVLGANHPYVLTTRKLEAEILHDLGEDERALALVANLLPDMERVQGSAHPHLELARDLRERILAAGETG